MFGDLLAVKVRGCDDHPRQTVSSAVLGGGEGERQSINLQDIKLSPNCIICYNFCYKLKQTPD